MDIIRTSKDLGRAVKRERLGQRLKAVEVARHSGRSRDILNRLENGADVNISSLMDFLSAMGLVLRIEKAGLPTLAEMKARYADLDED